MDFAGETALITGGGGDIGKQVAKVLLGGGASVALSDSDGDKLRAAAESLGSPERVATVRADLTDPEAVNRAVDQIKERFGSISILVNAVGVGQFGSFLDMGPQDWDRVIEINLNAPVNCIRSVLSDMVQAGRGTIVNICSIWSSRGGPDRSAYITSKHGLLGITRALAEEYRDQGIRVSAVSPGPVVTGMTRSWATPKELEKWMQPEEIAQVIAFACSQEADILIGSEIQAFGRGKPAGL